MTVRMKLKNSQDCSSWWFDGVSMYVGDTCSNYYKWFRV